MESPGQFSLGLSLALMNCALSSVGFTMQRKAQLLSEEHDDEDGDGYRCLWICGVLLYVTAAVPDVLSYTLVPQVVCTTVACFRLVLVTFLAHTLLKERVSGREILGMCACTMGTLLCLVFGPRAEAIGGEEAHEFYRPQVWTYVAVGMGLLVLLLSLEHAEDIYRRTSLPSSLHYFTLPLATGLAFALEKVFNTEIGFIRTPKGLEGLLEAPTWSATVLFIALLGLTDFYLNLRGATRMPVQVFLPVSFALATSLQFFQSVVIFGEFSEMSFLDAGLSISGAVVSLAGALLIQPPRLSALSHEELQDDDSEKGGHRCRPLSPTPEGSDNEAEVELE